MEFDNELLLPYISTRIKEGPKLVKESIYQDGEKLKYRHAFKNLKTHIDDFLNGYIENRFIVMPGLRGTGKTTLIFQLYDYLLNKKKIDNSRILYISADQVNEFLGENIYNTINVFIQDIHKKSPITLDKEIFVFIDESQDDEKWSQAGKIIYDESKKIFMIFTGSSALDLEIKMDAVRRTKKESIYPMNFKEHLSLKHDIQFPKGISTSIRNMILTGNVDETFKKERKMISNLSDLRTPLEKEFETYLCCGGFPISINLNEQDIHKRTYDMVERVIEKDIFHYQSFRRETKSTIFKIITFLSLQKPGELSEGKLASKIGVSSSIINNLLTILEKTHLIFHVNPYGSAGKTIRKPWKYYFLSPSIRSSINFKLGRYTPENREFLGILAENLVASYFFRMMETTKRPCGISYPPEKGDVDFLISKIDGEKIPIEVGIGKKDKKQVMNAMNKYNSSYGIIISNKTPLIRKEEDVIYIPLTTFSYI